MTRLDRLFLASLIALALGSAACGYASAMKPRPDALHACPGVDASGHFMDAGSTDCRAYRAR